MEIQRGIRGDNRTDIGQRPPKINIENGCKRLDKCLVFCYIIFMMTGLEIKELRKKKLKMTQQELADKLGVDPVTVSRWEREERRPSRLALRGLARLANNKKGVTK